MSSNDIVTSILIPTLVVAVAATYAYGAYWAFRIRSVLVNRLYRHRAQWIGIVGLFVALLAGSYLLINTFGSDNFYLSFLQYLITDIAGVVTFAWVDSTVLLVRRTDPLRRNTLSWSQLRIVLWAFVIITTIGGLTSVVIAHELFFSPQGGRGALISGPFGFSSAGLIAVLLSRRRSKDLTLRRHLKWLALYLFTIVLAGGVTGGQYLASIDILRIFSAAAVSIGAYFLFQAAKSLTPLNKLPAGILEDLRKLSRPAAG